MHDSDHQQDSSNIKQSYQIRNRRKIYDDKDFKEVVKNFYNLISEINRVKKITKAPIQKYLPKQKLRKSIKPKEPPKRDIKHNQQTIHQFFSHHFSQQILSQLNPHFQNLDKPSMLNKQQYKFQRNQWHIQIAFQIYISQSDSKLVEQQDPTSVARKIMKFQEEEKQSDVSEILNRSFEGEKNKPLRDLVRELKSDQ